MNQYELEKYGHELGLEVDKTWYYSPAIRATVIEIKFRTEPRWYNPSSRYVKGDLIASLKINDTMNQVDYEMACGLARNALKQFESWR